jgi:hypothetical protein
MSELVSKFWYPEVINDMEKILDAIEYYKHVNEVGETHTKMKGVIHRLLEEQPQMMQIYENTLVDCSMVHKWLEEQIKFQKAQKRIEYMRDPAMKDLKKTDIENYVTADENIQWHIQLMLMVELWKGTLDSLVTRLNRRGIYLTMISKLRISGEHEAYIDTTHETNPETL